MKLETSVNPEGGGLAEVHEEIRKLREEIGRANMEATSELRKRESRQFSELAVEIETRTRQLAELEARVAEEGRRREASEAEMQSLARRLADSEWEAARMREELAAIHGSRLWRTAHLYWHLLRRLRREPPKPLPPPVIPSPSPEPGREPAQAALPGPLHDVICFPIIDWGFRFQRPQQLMLQLARRGHRVFYVSQRFRDDGEPYEIRELASNVYEVSLRGPLRNVYSELLGDDDCGRLLDSLDALRRDHALAATAAVVQLPFWKPLVEKTWRSFAWPIVYDCMDHHAGFSTNRSEMLGQEDGLLAAAHLVLASSLKLYDTCRRSNPRVVLLPNGCDYEHFAEVGEPPRGTRPVIGYYGAIAEWFDSDLVADLAEGRPDWDFVLVGSTFTADLSRLSSLPNVTLAGEQSYASLPGWIDRFDVLILPFKRLPLTEATNPVKAYEILAAGRPLVSVPLPEMTRLKPLVQLAATAKEFEREIESSLAERDGGSVEARREFARENTWEKRIEALAPHLREAFPRVSIVIVTIDNLAINQLCLASLYGRTAWPRFEVIVVDNASTDGTAEFLVEAQKTYLSLQIVLNDHNAGFAAATNQGLQKASGDFLVLLNNDTVVTRGWLSTLIRHLNSRECLGLVGPVSNAVGNQAQIQVSYRTIEEMPEWAARYVREHDGERFPLPMLGMFCLALRRSTFERIGLLDERFGIGMFEDDDYSRRAQALGYETQCVRDAFVHHWQKSSFRALGETEYARIFRENRRKYEDKWGESWRTGVDIQQSRDVEEQVAALLKRVDESRGVIVLFPSLGWSAHGARRPHQLARAFAELGYVVVYQCIGASDWVEGLVEIEPNLFLFMAEQALLHRLPAPILWCQPFNFHLSLDFPPGARTVYDWDRPLNDYPFDLAFLESNHQRALAEASLLTSPVRKLWCELCKIRADALHLPDGLGTTRCVKHEIPVPDDPKLALLLARGRPIAGYCGDLADWLDYDLLEEVVRLRSDWSFLLVGAMHDQSLRGRALLQNPGVVWTGPREERELLGYLQLVDVALVPVRTDRGEVPVLLGDYLACGKPVVSTPIKVCRAIPEVRIARNAAEFAQELDAARETARDPAFRERLRGRACESSWRTCVQEMLVRLGCDPLAI